MSSCCFPFFFCVFNALCKALWIAFVYEICYTNKRASPCLLDLWVYFLFQLLFLVNGRTSFSLHFLILVVVYLYFHRNILGKMKKTVQTRVSLWYLLYLCTSSPAYSNDRELHSTRHEGRVLLFDHVKSNTCKSQTFQTWDKPETLNWMQKQKHTITAVLSKWKFTTISYTGKYY